MKKVKVVNVAAMREALSYIRRYVQMWIGTDVIDRTIAESIVATCAAALAKPARNCDVGTAEEQYKRFMAMCNSKDAKQCSTCMFRQNCYTSRDKCFARWAQMPYEEKAGGRYDK